jgi:hypothetical protein
MNFKASSDFHGVGNGVPTLLLVHGHLGCFQQTHLFLALFIITC